MSKLERRFFQSSLEVEERAEGKAPVIRGHAAVFNKLSSNLGGFRERIKPGAFKKSLAANPDVRALFNHDPSAILGRTTAGTLKVVEDEHGLRYEIDPPETTVARDLMVSLKRGDVNQSSFGFYVRTDEWHKENGQVIRELIEVDINDGDVSPVTYPAYPQTSSEARSAMWPDGVPEAVQKQLDEPKDVEIARLTVRVAELERSVTKAEAELASKVAEFTTMRTAAESANRELAAERTEREQSDRRSQEALSQAQQHIDSARTAIDAQRTRVYRNILAAERAKQLVT